MHLKTDTSSNSHYAQVPRISHSRNAFTVAEKHVTTIQFDALFPLYSKFIYPGDTLSVTQKVLARLQTQITTLFDDLYVDAHAWFVPMRLIQTDWARFQFNAQPAGPTQDNSALTTPSISWNGAPALAFKSLYDYFGYNPIGQNTSGYNGVQHVNNYMPRAYNLIWNENYRDQNLQTAAVVDLDNGPDSTADYPVRKRGKRHDLFTSALPFQQKGPQALIPMAGTAPIFRTPNAPAWTAYTAGANTHPATTGTLNAENATGNVYASGNTPPYMSLDPMGGIFADLSSASLATVNNLRQSIAVQHLLEADARGGTRDVESIAHRWGVQVPDFRLQRPEYLGGTTWTFDGHVVPQTSETGTTPQGNLVQFSQSLSSFNINHSFVEHGCFMILVSARSNLTYQDGLPKEYSYRTRYDFYQPEFANLGEVAIKNKEIYFPPVGIDNGMNDLTFGFQEYGYELRYGLNRVSSEMRSSYPQSLDSRHMAYDYGSLPTLSSGFIESFTPISRNIAVDTTVSDPIEINQLVEGRIVRTLPMYSIPGLDKL